MFCEIYLAIQQGQVLQQRLLEAHARRRWLATIVRRALTYK